MQPKNKSRRLRLALNSAFALGLILALTGCRLFSDKTVDVTNSHAWWGQLAQNEMLQLKQDTLLNGGVLTLSAYKFTDNYNSGNLFGGNISVEQYKTNPNKYWSELHLLPTGTRLKCVKLVRLFSFEYSRYVIWAEILDGEFKGKVVDLGGFTSGDPNRKGSLVLYSKFLEPVQ